MKQSTETADLAEKDVTYQKNANSENGRAGRLRREKYQRMNILKGREFKCCCPAERIEAIAIRCTFVMQSPREKNLQQGVIVISNVFETSSFAKKCSLRSFICLSASGAGGYLRLGTLPFSEESKKYSAKSSNRYHPPNPSSAHTSSWVVAITRTQRNKSNLDARSKPAAKDH